MDEPGLEAALFALAFATPGVVLAVGNWFGRFRFGSGPETTLDRLYLLTPIAVGFLLFGLGGLAGAFFAVPSVIRGIFYGGTVTLLVAGMILELWQPEWLRPGWQRRERDELEGSW